MTRNLANTTGIPREFLIRVHHYGSMSRDGSLDACVKHCQHPVALAPYPAASSDTGLRCEQVQQDADTASHRHQKKCIFARVSIVLDFDKEILWETSGVFL